MRRVVVTGLGVVSSIGNNAAEVAAALRDGKSGLALSQTHRDMGFKAQVVGAVKIDLEALIDRRARRFMGDTAAYAFIAMDQALKDSGLEEKDVVNPRTGLIVGSGGPSTKTLFAADKIAEATGPKKIGPFAVPKCMSSTCSAVLATWFKIKGVNYSISSACATSAHCIGNAAEQIAWGKQDVMFAGGGEELDWTLAALFDAMGAMASKYNDTPQTAARAFDKDRDGFVIAGGGGVLVLEELEHAKARGAKIYCELTGYGATSDGHDMVAPSGEGAARCMRQALATVKGPIDYVNAHGTATPVGDIAEVKALREVFGDAIPPVNSTKSLTGHSLGAAGAQEAIYSILQMQGGFIAASAGISELDPEIDGAPIVRSRIDNTRLERVLSNSFGFGGTNATLVFERV